MFIVVVVLWEICLSFLVFFFFFFNDTATTEIYTLSLHDALPIPPAETSCSLPAQSGPSRSGLTRTATRDRKSTRLNSSHLSISYAVFCLKKKKLPRPGPRSSTRTVPRRRLSSSRRGPAPGRRRPAHRLRASQGDRRHPVGAVFFVNDTATTEIYTLSLHDALPISGRPRPPAARCRRAPPAAGSPARGRHRRSEEHTSELQSPVHLVCRLLLEKKKKKITTLINNIIYKSKESLTINI